MELVIAALLVSTLLWAVARYHADRAMVAGQRTGARRSSPLRNRR